MKQLLNDFPNQENSLLIERVKAIVAKVCQDDGDYVCCDNCCDSRISRKIQEELDKLK